MQYEEFPDTHGMSMDDYVILADVVVGISHRTKSQDQTSSPEGKETRSANDDAWVWNFESPIRSADLVGSAAFDVAFGMVDDV